jgi:hypothetical protein
VRRALVVSSVGALAVLAFGPTFWSSFAADDFLLRYASIHATSLGSLLTSDPLAFQGGGNFFRPIWFAYDWVLTNTSGDPALYHALNVVIYAGVAVEVWLLLRSVVSAVPAAIAAGIFALYPRHTEAVAWYAGSMDLLPALFGLAAILLALQQWKRFPRLAAVAVMAGAAASSKENAYLLVPLFVLVQIVRREPLRGASKEARLRARHAVWEPAAAMILGGLAAVAWRLDVFHKVGGYSNHPWTPFRVVTAAGSDILAAASPPQLPMLINLPLIAVPVIVLVGILVLGGRVAIARPVRRRVMLGGLAFAVVALLPTLNVAVNINTSSDERFLFLPSVGLAMMLAGALPARPERRHLGVLAIVAALLLGLSIDSSLNWQRGSVLASNVADQVTALARTKGEVLLLAAPETYENAGLLMPGLDAAVSLRGGVARVAWCSALDVRTVGAGQVAFQAAGPGTYVGRTVGDARFHFPLSGGVPAPLTPDCGYEAGPSGPHLGSATSVTVRLTPVVHPVRLAFFDGKDVVVLSQR